MESAIAVLRKLCAPGEDSSERSPAEDEPPGDVGSAAVMMCTALLARFGGDLAAGSAGDVGASAFVGDNASVAVVWDLRSAWSIYNASYGGARKPRR